MSTVTLRTKFTLLCTVIGISAFAVTCVGYWSVEKLSDTLHQKVAVGEALKNHMQGDMMHDAIRADVLNGLLQVTTQGNPSDAMKDLKDHSESFLVAIAANKEASLPENISKSLSELEPALKNYISTAEGILKSANSQGYEAARQQMPSFREAFDELATKQEEVSALITEWSEAQVSTDSFTAKVGPMLIGLMILSVLLLATIPVSMIRWIFTPIRRISEDMQILATGNADITLNNNARNDEIGQMETSLSALRDAVSRNHQLQTMIENLSLPVMMCDKTYTIIFANKATLEALKKVEKFLPVPVEKIVGSNIDIFHKNPAHQRGMLSTLGNKSHNTEFKLGDEWLYLNANMMNDKSGNFTGAFIDWRIVTEEKSSRQLNADFQSLSEAISKSQAVIQFNMDGTIVDANENFLKTLGYNLDEIVGKHHSMFVEAEYRSSNDYKQFWESLNRGEYQVAEYKRIGKGGKEIWIQASYNPIMNLEGKPHKVVKYATDVTAQKLQNADYSGQIDAISKSQAVIEFNMDGTIINANGNFLTTLGYTLDEIRGKHHSMFVDVAYRNSADYKHFWESLGRGEYQSAEYKRYGKGGKEIWIQASYNPIMDLNNKPFKVVKYATDVTQMVQTRTENEQGMNEAVKVLTGVSNGDLTQKMQQEYKGTFSDIKKSLNTTIDRLCDMVRNIIQSAQAVNVASGEISDGSINLSSRTEQQASSLEETAASMEELNSTVRQNSENAKNANLLSSEACDVAQNGGRVVGDVVAAMSNIERSSQKISDIIGVIDEIAFQTNLLALNAAVEAARAGEAGKGFAVVASEVRSLAGRSASASKEIKALINESSQQVKTGATLVGQAGETLKEIVSSVKKVADIISEISTASQEQASGIDETSNAIAQMDEMTQQNAALVEENTAAAQSLVNQANELEQMMRFFSLNADEDATSGSQLATAKPVAAKAANGTRPGSIPAKQAKLVQRTVAVAAATGTNGSQASNGHHYDKDWEEF